MRLATLIWAWTILVPDVLQETRSPVPEPPARKEAERLIREVFREEYAKKDRPDRLALAQKLLAQALETKDDSAARFVLLTQASDLSSVAGDMETCLRAIGELSRRFDVDSLRMKESAIDTAVGNSRTADEQRFLAELSLHVSEEAVSREAYDSAEKLTRTAATLARKSKDLGLATRAEAKQKEIANLKVQGEKVKKAREILASRPDDGPANGIVGYHLCFRIGDWDRGLQSLAKGDDPVLQALASKELRGPKDPQDQVGLGDEWWSLSEKEEGSTRKMLQKRAVAWYEKAAPNISGLTRARIDKRRAEVGGAGSGPEAIDLLRLLDLKKDIVAGEWTFDGTTLVCAREVPAARVQIPYVPPDEYDLTLVAERTSGIEAINLGLSRGTSQFHLVIDGFAKDGYMSGLSMVDGKLAYNNETTRGGALLVNNRPSTIECFVRKTGVKMVVDGKAIFDWSGEFSRLSNFDMLKIPNAKAIYVSGWESRYRFSKLTLTPVSGKGEKTR